jgi:cephalosporin hydroxylase
MAYMKGHTTYYSKISNENLTAQQRPYAFEAFEKLLKEIRPARVLEIGTAGGGTIQYIREVLNDIGLESSEIKSFEIKEHKWFAKMRTTNIEIIIENIFDKSYKKLEKPELVVPFIQSEGVTLVLCDGGSKINEFNILAPLIKKGDYIMAHDYIDTKENFLENFKDKIWNWREIGEEHIVEVSKKENLKTVYQDIVAEAAWVCKIKE